MGKERNLGEDNARAKLTDREVELLRQLVEAGMALIHVANKFEISKSHACNLMAYRRRAVITPK